MPSLGSLLDNVLLEETKSITSILEGLTNDQNFDSTNTNPTEIASSQPESSNERQGSARPCNPQRENVNPTLSSTEHDFDVFLSDDKGKN